MTDIHLVVRNDEEQYSTWSDDRPLPAGWHPMGVTGSMDDCLAYIDRVWTDMRPRSARREGVEPPRVVHDADRLQLREVLPVEAACLLTDGHRHASWAAEYPLDGTRPPAEALIEAHSAGKWRPGFGMFQIVLGESGRVVGDLGFHAIPADGSVQIGYGIVPEHRGQGYVTEAVVMLTDWALAQPDVTTVVAETTPDNLASQGVLVRAGFTLASASDDKRVYHRITAAR